MWKRYLIVAACIALAAARVVWPDAKIDTTTGWLLGIAVIAILLPQLRAVVPYIKRVKLGDAEVELREQIERTNKEVTKAQQAVGQRADAGISPAMNAEIEEVLSDASQDPRAAFLLLATKIEWQVRERLSAAAPDTERRFLPLTQAVEKGVQLGLFPKEMIAVFRDFWIMRNRVAHGAAFDVADSTVLSLISIGVEILKLVSLEHKDGQSFP